MLPVFTRQESNTRLAGVFHGTDGQLIVDDPMPKHGISAAITSVNTNAPTMVIADRCANFLLRS